MKNLLILCAGAVSLLMLADSAIADSGRLRGRGPHGVVVAGHHNGNSHIRGRRHQTNSDGSFTTASRGAFSHNNGAHGARQATSTVNPDGSAVHSGNAHVSGVRGTASTSGSFARDNAGNATGARSSTVTAANGNTYTGTTAYDKANGFTHSGTCRNASGATITCPNR